MAEYTDQNTLPSFLVMVFFLKRLSDEDIFTVLPFLLVALAEKIYAKNTFMGPESCHIGQFCPPDRSKTCHFSSVINCDRLPKS